MQWSNFCIGGFNIFSPHKHTHLGLLSPGHPLHIEATHKVQLGVQSPSRTQQERRNWRGRRMSQARAPGLARCPLWFCVSWPLCVSGNDLERHRDPDQQGSAPLLALLCPHPCISLLFYLIIVYTILSYTIYPWELTEILLEGKMDRWGDEWMDG